MKNFKEILRCRIEETLDYDFNNHISLISNYLAEKLLATLDKTSGELNQIERHQAAMIILRKTSVGKEMADGEVQSVFDKQIDEQNEALELAADMLLNPVAHLTPKELVHAYNIQQHEYDKSDIENELDAASDDYEEKYNIDKKPVTDEEIDRMAYELRRILDRDADACWSQARAEAVETVLSARKHGYVIGRPINGISINGLEYVQDDDGVERIFDSIEDAKAFLNNHGIKNEEIETQGIIFKEFDEYIFEQIMCT